jgi:predicted TIM-barrel fold metal-dependent hydrolase
MIIDVHTHVAPPQIRDDRETYTRAEEPAFASIYSDPRARLVGAAELVEMMNEQGVHRSVCFGFPWSQRETARRHNDYVLAARERWPDRLIPLACFDMMQPWALEEARRCLQNGAAGLGELAVYDAGFDEAAVARLAELGALCRETDAALMLHVNEPVGHQYLGKAPLTIREIYAVIEALAGVRLILAHWGGGIWFYNLLTREAPEVLGDVHYDTAASPFLYRPLVYRIACDIIGPEKVLLGSDYPLLPPTRYFDDVRQAGLTDEGAAAVLGGSAARFFGLE